MAGQRLGKHVLAETKQRDNDVGRDSDLRMTALARTSSNGTRQIHPLVRDNVT
jgi:hypothetical protein